MAAVKTPDVVSFINLKGGVGKTALSVNFAAYCGRNDLKTLLIDLDPQANSTFSCVSIDAWEEHASKKGTVANLLGVRQHTSAEGKPRKASDVLIPDVFKNVDLIPSHLDLFTVDLDLGSETARETKLKRATRELLPAYDVVICDCPPNLTIPTQNAIALSTHYVVPVSPDFLSGVGVGLLLSRVDKLSADLENKIVHAGIVMSRVGRPSQFREQTKKTLRTTFGDTIFTSEIKERSSVSEAAAKNKSIFTMGDDAAAAEFTAFGDELLEKLGYEI
jgi:chromosome partitioning protein